MEVAHSGADFMGFVMVPQSRRFVEPKIARELIALALNENQRLEPVLVTVDLTVEELIELAQLTGTNWVQLHGNESAQQVEELRRRGLRVIKAIKVGAKGTLLRWEEYAPDLFLCDTYDPNLAGGTGKQWEKSWLPVNFPLAQTLVAGGVTADNATKILQELRPYGLDVSSGVEISPGVKDPLKIRLLVKALADYASNQTKEK